MNGHIDSHPFVAQRYKETRTDSSKQKKNSFWSGDRTWDQRHSGAVLALPTELICEMCAEAKFASYIDTAFLVKIISTRLLHHCLLSVLIMGSTHRQSQNPNTWDFDFMRWDGSKYFEGCQAPPG